MAFSILTDSSANLPAALVWQHGLSIVPFSYYREGKEYTCTNADVFDADEYYGAMRRGARFTTSQITPQRYVDTFRPFLAAGKELLFIGMSSGISGSFHSAELAAAELREEYPSAKIRLVDSLAASLGEGLQVLRAVKARAQGLDLDATADLLLELRSHVCQVFTVDDLMYLRKGGRLSGAVAVVGTVLNIKPILKGNENGQIVSCGRVRGRRRSIEALAAKYEALVENAAEQTVGIAHADCAEDAEYLKTLLNQVNPPREILTVGYEPVTGSHVGPGTLALFFLGGSDVRSK